MKKGQTQIDGMDGRIIGLYAAGLTVRENRGVQDVLSAVLEGLRGFSDAITAAFPEAAVRTGPLHRHNPPASPTWRAIP